MAGGETQGVSPKFKPQYHHQKKKRTKKPNKKSNATPEYLFP
jgi:hypothetical protein